MSKGKQDPGSPLTLKLRCLLHADGGFGSLQLKERGGEDPRQKAQIKQGPRHTSLQLREKTSRPIHSCLAHMCDASLLRLGEDMVCPPWGLD